MAGRRTRHDHGEATPEPRGVPRSSNETMPPCAHSCPRSGTASATFRSSMCAAPKSTAEQRTHMPAYPEEGALRGGHIPTAAIGAVVESRERGRHLQIRGRPQRDLHSIRPDSAPQMRSSPTAASGSAPATPGSFSNTCWATTTSATTTVPGPSGATLSVFPSPPVLSQARCQPADDC